MKKKTMKKWIVFLTICLIAVLQSCRIPLAWDHGVLHAEAAAKQVGLNKKSVVLTAGGKTTVRLKNIRFNKKVTWSSKNKKVAAVKKGSGGKATITAKKVGTAKITASYMGRKYTCTVKVKTPNVKLSASSVTVAAGDTAKLTLNHTVKGKKVIWKSSKTSVATVKKNRTNQVTITGKKAGKAAIKAIYNGKTYQCKVTVKAQSLNRSSLSLLEGETGEIVLNNPVSNKTTKVCSTDNKVATVSLNGSHKIIVKAISAGNAVVQVEHNGKILKCKVTVSALEPSDADGEIPSFSQAPEGSYFVYDSSTIVIRDPDSIDGATGMYCPNASGQNLYSEDIYVYSRGSYLGEYIYRGKVYNVYAVKKSEDADYTKFAADFMNQYAGKCEGELAKLLSIPVYFKEIGIVYDVNSSPSYFKGKKWVCYHYAEATYALCKKLGIPVATVSSSTANHTWTQVYINGKWRVFDTVGSYLEGTFDSQYLNYEADSVITKYSTSEKPPVAKEGLGYYVDLEKGVMYDYSSEEIFQDAWVNGKGIPIPGWGI